MMDDLLDFDVGIYKRPPTFSVDDLTDDMGFSDLLFGNGLSKPFPYDKYAGIGEAARGATPCTERSDAKQPGLHSSGLSASQSAHTGLAPV